MQKLEQLYEGKAKKVFRTDDPELYIVDYKDDATAFNGLKKGTIAGKGVINNQMTNHLMRRIEKAGIPTHFVQELSERETLVKKVSIVPLEVIIRNLSAGSFAKRYGVEEGIVFDAPTIEFSYKNDELGDPRPGAEAGHSGGDRDHQEVRLCRQRHSQGLLGRVRRHAGGLQAGVRQTDRRHDRSGGRDQPRHLPPLGRKDP